MSPRRMDDLGVMVAGQGGDGSLTVVTLLGRLLGRRGYHMYTARDVASRIKGGHAAALMRGSLVPRGGMGDHLDLLVAFDDEAILKAGRRLAPDGIVIFDASAGPPPGGALPDGVEVIEVPFARLSVRDLRRDLFKNGLAFGIVTRLLGVGDDEAASCVEARFGQRGGALLAANLRALEVGLAHADEAGFGLGEGPWALHEVPAEDRILIPGNEALAMGFVAAGGRVFTGYPITPASEILDWLDRNLGEVGGIAIQAEDELAAINMAVGAALTGVRTMTATSGPGISLMQEGVSHAGSAEVPLVIVDCQRSGPSTGMPTKPEQSDLGMVVHGGNGDFPRIVLAPGGPAECFELGAAATGLAQRLQGPVYLVLDQAISQDSATVPPFDFEAIEVEQGSRLDEAAVSELDEYRRYLLTEDGVSPWAVPGTPGGMSLVTGNERDEWGLVSTAAANRVAMMDKRARKLAALRPQLPDAVRWGDASAGVGILGIGMEAGVMVEASERLAAEGIGLAGLRPRTLWPVPDEVIEFIQSCQRVYVVEHNAEGQLAHLLISAGAPSQRITSILRYDGLPFTPGGLAGSIREAEAT